MLKWMQMLPMRRVSVTGPVKAIHLVISAQPHIALWVALLG